jgi:hypothetical protein
VTLDKKHESFHSHTFRTSKECSYRLHPKKELQQRILHSKKWYTKIRIHRSQGHDDSKSNEVRSDSSTNVAFFAILFADLFVLYPSWEHDEVVGYKGHDKVENAPYCQDLRGVGVD